MNAISLDQSSSTSTRNQNIPGYDEVIAKLLEITFSSSPDRLNEFVNDPTFMRVAHEELGFEAGVFYFYDSPNHTLQQFSEALPDGLNLPFTEVRPNNDATRFRVRRRPKKEWEEIERLRRDYARSRSNPITAQMCYHNLTSKIPRRSKSEEKCNWIFIPHGERSVFFFEWAVWSVASEKDYSTSAAILQRDLDLAFVHSCWDLLYNNPSFRRMNKRGLADYKAALHWLDHALHEENGPLEFPYLWMPASNTPMNWFIKHACELRKLLANANRDQIDYTFLCHIVRLIVESCGIADTTNLGLEGSLFYQRARFAPPMELIYGPINIIAFLVTSPVEVSVSRNEHGVHAFLIGVFQDEAICNHQFLKIKALYYSLALRDIIRLSNRQLSAAYQTIKRSGAMLQIIHDSYFLHELHGPLSRMKMAISRLTRALSTSDLADTVRDATDNIIRQHHRINRALEALLNITRSLIGDLRVVDFSKCVARLLADVRTELQLPQETIVERYPQNELRVLLDTESMRVVLVNLISNAMDAIAEGNRVGRIMVTVDKEDEFIRLSVCDDGKGIDPAITKTLFNKFVSTKTTDKKGLGLGLFICKRLLEGQGGRIVATNRAEGGACFTIYFKQHMGWRTPDEESTFNPNY